MNDDFVADARLADTQTAYAIGAYGTAKKTSDGGMTWVDIGYSGPWSGTELFPINKDTVFFAGLDNLFFTGGAFGRTTSGGFNWSVDTISTNIDMHEIFFYDYYKGWIAGGGGEIKVTNDAGMNWSSCNSGITGNIRDLVFTDSLNGWAVSDSGEIIHSLDGGLNWNIQYSDTVPLYAISFPKPGNIGYAFGRDGRVLKYTPDASVPGLNKNNPFSLFPNPVTNQLNLIYNSPEECHFILYDIFSRKVIHQEFTNSISLNTEQLTKGIYIYEVRNKEGVIKKGKVIKQ